MTDKEEQNRLAGEESPYLLQHAGNPVDWYPWGEEAFAKAQREDKPIFLSIGYSTCHWCHVMERESFEDTAVARLMNEAFVSIKVDREERPDIDNIYMNVCQMMTGSGGWPLTIIMTPDKQPFFAGTYIPKDNRYGRVGMMEFVPRVMDYWNNRRAEAMSSAAQISESLSKPRPSQAGPMPDVSTLPSAAQGLQARFDSRYGGFGDAPKFPTPHNLTLLLRHWKRTGDKQSLAIVERTLTEMRRGGIYDQIGFGFHRYSTDARWLVPHFEKMLYDQALLLLANVEAYQATGIPEYAKTAEEIIAYVRRDMTSPEGAFYSAEDADSEGEEGKFYLWSTAEVHAALDPVDAELFIRTFNLQDEGNFLEQSTREKTGANIPHFTAPLSETANKTGMAEDDLAARLESIRQKLFAVRKQRVHPQKDDKALTDWNGLLIAAMSKAAQALDRPEHSQAARGAADFVLLRLRRPDGRLLHRYRDGNAGLDAHLDDYAFMVWGLLELYEAEFDIKYLQSALELNRIMLDHFWDDENGGLFFTADDAESLLVRPKETYDGAIPSGNSVAMLNLARLGRTTGDQELERKAEAIGRAFANDLRQIPGAHSQMLQAVDFMLGPSNEIVICGSKDASDTQEMFRGIRSLYLPNKVVLFKPTDEQEPMITRLAEFTRTMSTMSGKATAYVCRNFACRAPTTEPQEMLRALREE